MPRGIRVGCDSEELSPKSQAARLPLHELLRREGGDDFFEARIAAQRVPRWHQFQFAIADGARNRIPNGRGKLFASEILFTDPRSNHCQMFDHVETID